MSTTWGQTDTSGNLPSEQFFFQPRLPCLYKGHTRTSSRLMLELKGSTHKVSSACNVMAAVVELGKEPHSLVQSPSPFLGLSLFPPRPLHLGLSLNHFTFASP